MCRDFISGAQLVHGIIINGPELMKKRDFGTQFVISPTKLREILEVVFHLQRAKNFSFNCS